MPSTAIPGAPQAAIAVLGACISWAILAQSPSFWWVLAAIGIVFAVLFSTADDRAYLARRRSKREARR